MAHDTASHEPAANGTAGPGALEEPGTEEPVGPVPLGSPVVSQRVALVGGPMYDGLYEILADSDVEVVVHAPHPELNRVVERCWPRASGST